MGKDERSRHNEYNDKRISIGMTDSERYDILKDKTIEVPHFDNDKLAKIDADDYAALERIGKSGAFKILRKIGEDFGVFKEGYATQDLDVNIRFSRGNLQESINKQHGRFQNYAEFLTVLDVVANNAIGIETHFERYSFSNSKVDKFYVLVGAIYGRSSDVLIPVMFGVKTFTDKTTSSLYFAVTLHDIERSRILGHTPDINSAKPCPSPTSITVSLADILSNVNISDKNLLKYIPDGFLIDEQKEAKEKALRETAEYIEKKNRQHAAKASKSEYGDSFVSESLVEYQRDEDTVIFVFHKKSA